MGELLQTPGNPKQIINDSSKNKNIYCSQKNLKWPRDKYEVMLVSPLEIAETNRKVTNLCAQTFPLKATLGHSRASWILYPVHCPSERNFLIYASFWLHILSLLCGRYWKLLFSESYGCHPLLVATWWICSTREPAPRAKKVMSTSLGLVDFAIGLVNPVLNLPDRQVKVFLQYSNYKRMLKYPARQKILRAS